MMVKTNTQKKLLKPVQFDELTMSGLALGGSKMVDIALYKGIEIVNRAINLGINVFDAHHRYGRCQEILGYFSDVVKMTKVSAYKDINECETILKQNTDMLKNGVEIYWVSDLDDCGLYEKGAEMYKRLRDNSVNISYDGYPLRGRIARLGITTESPEMGFRFLSEYPECNYYMIPLHFLSPRKMFDFVQELKHQKKHVFVIKPFNDGVGMEDLDINLIKNSLILSLTYDVDVICFGTQNIKHLEETVEIFSQL